MNVGVILQVTLLTCVIFLSKTQAVNSPHVAFSCEDSVARLTCENYPGKIRKILNVGFPKDNHGYCDNFKSIYKNNLCIASEKEKENLISVLDKYCKNKVHCGIHMAHGSYEGIYLPCRGLNISVRVEIIYDCSYEEPHVPDKESHITIEPTTTAASSTYLSTLPNSRLTSSTLETSINPKTTTITGEPTVAPTKQPTKGWKRLRPQTCNFTEYNLTANGTESSASGFPSSVLPVMFSWLAVLMKY